MVALLLKIISLNGYTVERLCGLIGMSHVCISYKNNLVLAS